MASNTLTGDLRVLGNIAGDSFSLSSGCVSNDGIASNAAIARSKLAQDALKCYPIPWEAWRVFDAFATNLPGTSANDDLALVGGAHGTNSPSIQTSDLKSAGATTRKARVVVALPAEYDAGQTVTLRISGGMITTAADNAATVDVIAYKGNREAGIGSDLCATAAQSINSLNYADKDFTITPTGLEPGDVLDIEVDVAVNDAASGTAVIACLGAVEMLFDVKG